MACKVQRWFVVACLLLFASRLGSGASLEVQGPKWSSFTRRDWRRLAAQCRGHAFFDAVSVCMFSGISLADFMASHCQKSDFGASGDINAAHSELATAKAETCWLPECGCTFNDLVKNTGSGTNEFEAVSRPFGNLQIHSTEECCFSSEYLQLKSCSLNSRLTGNAHKLSIQDSEDADGAVPEMCFATPPSIRKFVASSNDRAAPEQSFATRVLIHDLAKADGDGAVPDRVWSSFELEAYEEEWFPDWRCFSAQDSGLGLSISPRVSKCTEEFENFKVSPEVSQPRKYATFVAPSLG